MSQMEATQDRRWWAGRAIAAQRALVAACEIIAGLGLPVELDAARETLRCMEKLEAQEHQREDISS